MYTSTFLLKNAIFFAIILGCLTACYRMPDENDYSVVPMVNNPDFTREGTNPLMPNMGM